MVKILEKIFIFLLVSVFSIGNQVVYAASGDLPTFDFGAGISERSNDGTDSVYDVTSPNSYGQWPDFSIGADNSVTFELDSSLSSGISINRVSGTDPSIILGELNAKNIQFILINPNDILIGKNAKLDVGSLIASTLELSHAGFADGKFVFSKNGSAGSVINYADLSTAGGYVALLGSNVRNYGSVVSNLGTVALAAGDQITLSLDAGSLINIAVDKEVTQNLTSADAAVENFGTLKSDGGQVILTAKTLDGIFDKAINNEGIIEAKALSGQDRAILLSADDNIVVAGRVEAEGDIEIKSTDGNVEHRLSWIEGSLQGLVKTFGGDFLGSAGNDYVLRNGTGIETDGGNFDVAYGGDFVQGTETDDVITSFDWKYAFGDRGYKFVEFGYYNDNGDYVSYTPVTQGNNIGKDGFARLSGSGSVYGDDVKLYTKFLDYNGKPLYYFSEPQMNSDGLGHTVEADGQLGWEDFVALGDGDFNDAIFDYTERMHVIPGNVIPPIPDGRGYGDEYKDEFPVYYEILSPSQFLSFEPATAIGLYAYHPLTPVDQTAFDGIQLDVDAYEFIDENIKKKEFSPYFGE